jgi:hypothetical protein
MNLCSKSGCDKPALGWRELKDGGGTHVHRCADHIKPDFADRLVPVGQASSLSTPYEQPATNKPRSATVPVGQASSLSTPYEQPATNKPRSATVPVAAVATVPVAKG